MKLTARNSRLKDVLHAHIIDKLALLNGFISGIALYPQLFKTISSGLSDGLSETTLFVISLNSIIWIIYSLHRRLFALLIASILNVLASGVLFLILLAV